MNTSTLVYILAIIVAILTATVIRLELRLKKLLRGNRVNSIEDSLISALKDIEILDESRLIAEKEFERINEEIKKRIRTPETIRFNPFSDAGGKQSFASAFTDSHGNGVVLSSIYSRDKVSVFAKPLKGHRSDYELSEEEKEAIERVKNS